MPSQSSEIPDYIFNIRWAIEGFVLLAIGILGVVGNFFPKYTLETFCHEKCLQTRLITMRSKPDYVEFVLL